MSQSTSADPFTEMIKQQLIRQVKRTNEKPGLLNLSDGINCELCKNRGFTEVFQEESLSTKFIECECRKARRSVALIKESGLEDALKKCTFENFEKKKPHQKIMYQCAEDYLKGNGSDWLFFGGQVGSGKTHLCTAVCGELLRQGKEVLYVLWKDESTKLKAEVGDEEAYSRDINRLKTVDVLYIDDLFKSNRKQPPTTADVNLAFEIINNRYIQREKKTIISSELTIDDLIAIDEAIGSRIYEKSKESCVEISRDETKNYRMKDRYE